MPKELKEDAEKVKKIIYEQIQNVNREKSKKKPKINSGAEK